MPDSAPLDEAFYRRLVENASDLIAVVDATGTIEYVSPAVERVLGFPSDTARGRSALDVVHPDDRDATVQALQEELAGIHTRWYIELRMRSATGEWIPLEVKGRLDERSPTPRMIIHARDLRERLRVEQQLDDQHQWNRALVESSPIAIITLDRSLTTTSWNAAAERMFGWSAQEVLGRELPIVPTDAPDHRARLREALEEGRSFPAFETQRVRRDGRFVDVSVSLAPIRGADGSVHGVMKLVSDITQQKLLERQFRQAEQLDATARLTSGIAHDFNNLLGTIVTSAGLLRDELDASSPLHGDAEAILDAAHRAAELTRQLRTLGRRKNGQTTRLDVAGFTHALGDGLRALVPPSISLTFDNIVESGHVIAEAAQLREAVHRLVTNAVEAMPRGGALTVAARLVTMNDQDATAAQLHPGRYAMLAISDTGVGMPEDVLARCFEPFYTTKHRKTNPGLGLATAYAIARQAGGGISASSAVGIGTTMRLYLPLVADEAPVRVTPSVAQPTVSGPTTGTVLLVEDDGVFRAVVRRALTQQGYRVLDAGGGTEALFAFEQHGGTVDLLVTDLVMPDISGRELARRLRSLQTGLPVLYMSGYTADVLRENGGLDRSEAFIQKPFSPADFIGTVRNLFELLA